MYVTGALGGAAAELAGMLGRPARGAGAVAAALRGWAEVEVQERHPQMFPQPRMGVGEALRRRGLATACMDLSDGLSTDVRERAGGGGGGAGVGVGLGMVKGLAGGDGGRRGGDGIRLAGDGGRRADGIRLALHGGEDYELLFTADAAVRVPRRIGGVAVTRIGSVVRRRRGEALVMGVGMDGRRSELRAGGWGHSRGGGGGES